MSKFFKKKALIPLWLFLLSLIGKVIETIFIKIIENIDWSAAFSTMIDNTKSFFTRIGSGIVTILTFSTPVWIILLSICILFVIFLFVLKYLDSKEPISFNYDNKIKEMAFKKWYLKWEYDYKGKPVNINAICGECKHSLQGNSGSYGQSTHNCVNPECGMIYPYFKDKYRQSANMYLNTLNDRNELDINEKVNTETVELKNSMNYKS